MNRSRLRERYLEDKWPRQVGNLASTLTRLSSRTQDVRFDHVVGDLLRESALLIEWSAPFVPLELAAKMAQMQRELVLWHRVWPGDAVRALLAFRARSMADLLLESAGYL